MESEIIAFAMFLVAMFLLVINSMGVDSYVCFDVKLLLRGTSLTQSQIVKKISLSKLTNLFSRFETTIHDFVRL
jgi:hypothetical protein